MPATTSEDATSTNDTSLARLLKDGASAKDIERHLDARSPTDRLAEVLAITGKNVGRLYDALADAPLLTMDEIVPTGAVEGETIIFQGRNSLPMFSRFQKRFMRIGEDIIGYNHQTMSFVTGPGYFLVKPARGEGPRPKELYFDYTAVPPKAPEGWPKYSANERGLARAVYMNMHDYMRRVCRGVMVGKAYKLDVDQGAYFTLSHG